MVSILNPRISLLYYCENCPVHFPLLFGDSCTWWVDFEFFIECRYYTCQMYSGKALLPFCYLPRHRSQLLISFALQKLVYFMQCHSWILVIFWAVSMVSFLLRLWCTYILFLWFVLFLLFFFSKTWFLFTFGVCPGTSSCRAHWPLTHRDPPTSASQVLGLKAMFYSSFVEEMSVCPIIN